LVRAHVSASFTDNAASISLENNAVAVGVTGAIIAMLPLLRQGDSPRIAVSAARFNGGAITLEIAGTPVVLPEAKRFFDPTWVGRPGGWSAAVGAKVARNAAERHGGSAAFHIDTSGGGRVKLLLATMQPSVQNLADVIARS